MRRCLKCDHTFDGAGWTCPGCGQGPEIREGFPCFAPHLMVQADAFDVESFVDLARTEEQNFWYPLRNRLIVWALRKYFSDAKSLFELGCGTGIVLKAIAGAAPETELWGGDIYVQGLTFARERLGDRSRLIQIDGTDLPFRGHFDVVCAFDVIEHIDDDLAAMAELYRACRSGGGAMVIVPRHKFMWSAVDDLAQHKRRYAGRELRERMERAGFRIVRQLTFGALTLPLQFVSRRLMPQSGDKLSDVLELEIPRYQQAILSRLLRLDQAPIRLGVDYPFGASLMAIARKP